MGGKIDLPDSDSLEHSRGTYRFGYITEKVRTFNDEIEFGQAWRWYEKRQDELDKIVQDIAEQTGFRLSDVHGKNWGQKDGKYVIVDFGNDDESENYYPTY